MKSIFRYILSYIVVILIWVVIFWVINDTKNSHLFAIDNIITAITLLSLAFQHFKIEEITFIQDRCVNQISITNFAKISSHCFFVMCVFIFPLISYEAPRHINSDNEDLISFVKLSKQFTILAFTYFIAMWGLYFIGRDVDNSTNSNISRKYGVFYGILFVLYVTIKWTVTE